MVENSIYKFFTDYQAELYSEHAYFLDKLNPSTNFWYFDKLNEKKTFVYGVASHNYYLEYAKLFNPIREKVKKVLEIGVFTGYSVLMWSKYFPNAQIYGTDLELGHKHLGRTPIELCKNEERIKLYEFDAYNNKHAEEFINLIGGDFDIIIDDGSHHPLHQLQAINLYLPYLKKDGIFIIEDVVTDMETFTRITKNNALYEKVKMETSSNMLLEDYLKDLSFSAPHLGIDLNILKDYSWELIPPKEFVMEFKDTNLRGRDCTMKMNDIYKMMIIKN